MYLFDLAGDIDFVSHYKLVENHKIDGYAKAFVVEDGDWDTVLTYKVRLYVTSRTKDQTGLKRVWLITGISRTDPSSLVIEYLLWRFLQLVLKKKWQLLSYMGVLLETASESRVSCICCTDQIDLNDLNWSLKTKLSITYYILFYTPFSVISRKLYDKIGFCHWLVDFVFIFWLLDICPFLIIKSSKVSD